MDIGSGKDYPSNALSNFAPHPFVYDGVECNSMEGFLQGLKFSNPAMQAEICTYVGAKAKRAGSKKNWKTDQTLYWKGNPIKRDSDEYQALLDGAYEALSLNDGFRRALLASQDSNLTHKIGKTKENDTVLTIREFCGRLTAIRTRLQQEERDKKHGISYE